MLLSRKTASQGKVRVYMGILQLFCAYYQRNFPYHIDRGAAAELVLSSRVLSFARARTVESNDALYGGNEEYMKQVGVMIESLVQAILNGLTEIGEAGDIMARKKQGTLALEFVNVLISFINMNNNTANVVVKLFQVRSFLCEFVV